MLRQILKNMGPRYVLFRGWYEISRKGGWLKRRFPSSPPLEDYVTLDAWKAQGVAFFFEAKESLRMERRASAQLEQAYHRFLQGKVCYFNAEWIGVGRDYDWLTNPSTGFRYDIRQHWCEVQDLSPEQGDIKYVWEKSRFSYIYDIIRYDYHFDKDCAALVFSEMDSWMNANPINQGPNYKCSQEISLRVFNWLFALYYYKHHEKLTEARFKRIMHFIRWQLEHVFENIHFSRIAVRNNHAVTETLMLYLGGLLLPFLPNAKKWKERGKDWFEREIAYQIYEDGTFLQFSHNYHRVLVQLLTIAFYTADANGERFTQKTYQKAYKTLDYLIQCADKDSGELPNYGSNDGALFFKFNDQPYRDYRPQINALHFFLTGKSAYLGLGLEEDISWYSRNMGGSHPPMPPLRQKPSASFDDGGYYLFRDGPSFSFIRCGKHKDRPAHADNLHLDIWHKGQNVFHDSGTYRYNTGESGLSDYFVGTRAHNTAALGESDQMLKAGRFIWYHWSQSIYVDMGETEEYWVFSGEIMAFAHLGKNIRHKRIVKKYKGMPKWEVVDEISHHTNEPVRQYWHLLPQYKHKVSILAQNKNGDVLPPEYEEGHYSSHYGEKEISEIVMFSSLDSYIATQLIIKG
jgi:hypothetical protein